MLQDMVNTSNKFRFLKGCRWFQLFFIDFHLFHFLVRISAGIKKKPYFICFNRVDNTESEILSLTVFYAINQYYVCTFVYSNVT